jgi:hypothetical protein
MIYLQKVKERFWREDSVELYMRQKFSLTGERPGEHGQFYDDYSCEILSCLFKAENF